MFRLRKEEKQTENWLMQDLSQDDNDVTKNGKAAVTALVRKRYSTTKTQKQETF